MNQTGNDLKPEHKIFADEYILTNNKIESYLKAFPKGKKSSASVEVSRLLKKTNVSEYIRSERERLRLERENSAIETMKTTIAYKILKREEGLAMLTEVAHLTMQKIRRRLDDGEEISMYDAQSLTSTIEKLAKIDGWEKPIKIAETDKDGNNIGGRFVLNVIKTYTKQIDEAEIVSESEK